MQGATRTSLHYTGGENVVQLQGFPSRFWVVTKPKEELGVLGDICFESNILQMANQFRGGLQENEIFGVYVNQSMAEQVAKELLGIT
jgi:hypothetical protein